MPADPPWWSATAEDPPHDARGKERSCHFGGVVTSVEPVTTRLLAPRTALLHGLRVTFDAEATEGCDRAELTSVLEGHGAVPGPIPDPWQKGGCTRVLLGVPAGFTLPFGPGARVCGSLRRYKLGYDPGEEVVVLDPQGGLLLAFATAMPRTASPLPGWTVRPGPERAREHASEDYTWVTHDLRIAHDGALWTVRARAAPERFTGQSGASFRVTGHAYRTISGLPPWLQWARKPGYGFALAREAP